ncbi:hypothetical protein PU629_17775 [Pullulanibacillus sp. KACC 23026]|uniref:hypothetical protein n=1 Tax=Pullulanibacillus sp. KACC 23026 TaxID=3028315 RepID=UPI0023B0E3DF|nr:hypothetical protein [Pullulanibacillus sp. KACC 23026]WEG11955.1 hypothetical protein PU629_17775 [Pullulanibacillus sp. KACC 23026]
MTTNVILKFVLSPVIVILCDWFSLYQIHYESVLQALIIGFFVAIVNTAFEWLFFAKGTYWITTIFDFILTLCVVYFGSMMFPAALVTTIGALSITILITLMEYFLHNWLWRHNRGTDLATK